ncbi:cupin domain-containing protein [Prosthecobacter sp.]|uniref:cupin domain-containing protein n=1 Tax=Prosthecobacter sp. TaxID=1965333 RepID=UPI0037851548
MNERDQRLHSVSITPLNQWESIALDDHFKTHLMPWKGIALQQPLGDHVFGYVLSGPARLTVQQRTYDLVAGMFFAGPPEMEISGGTGILIGGSGEAPIFLLGGPIEENGRLRYIDGCMDSLLIAPVSRGSACLNALYFPKGTDQTMHTHPSVRVGLVVRGGGVCKCATDKMQLRVGDLVVIPPNAVHGFTTAETGMTVIAYHPDSNAGSTDDDHVMLNGTIVDGVPASQIDSIRTQAS